MTRLVVPDDRCRFVLGMMLAEQSHMVRVRAEEDDQGLTSEVGPTEEGVKLLEKVGLDPASASSVVELGEQTLLAIGDQIKEMEAQEGWTASQTEEFWLERVAINLLANDKFRRIDPRLGYPQLERRLTR